MNVSDAICTKRAVRKFLDKPLPDDIIHAILNAGRAKSGFGFLWERFHENIKSVPFSKKQPRG